MQIRILNNSCVGCERRRAYRKYLKREMDVWYPIKIFRKLEKIMYNKESNQKRK